MGHLWGGSLVGHLCAMIEWVTLLTQIMMADKRVATCMAPRPFGGRLAYCSTSFVSDLHASFQDHRG